jgi:hypothetical protein
LCDWIEGFIDTMRSEVHIVMSMKMAVFWNIALCNLVDDDGDFGDEVRLYL